MRDSIVFRFFVVLGGLGVYILPFLLGMTLVFSWFDNNFLMPVDEQATEPVHFQIKQGWTLSEIAQNLAKRDLIRNSISIEWIGKLKKSDNPEAFTIKPGEYELSKSLSPTELLNTLISGKTVEYKINIPIGATVKDVAIIIANTELLTEKQAYDALRNQRLMAQLGVPAYIPEGYLLAGSYDFVKPITADKVVEELILRSKRAMDFQLRDWQTRASELGYRPYEILVLASLIFRETNGIPTEQKAISAVYHNRLRIGMQLQSEAALRYGMPGLPQPLSEKDRAIESPYNTFTNIGLPPTPICTPSIDAIKAALYPDDTDHLYFFKKAQGSFEYSSTFKEHQRKITGQE